MELAESKIPNKYESCSTFNQFTFMDSIKRNLNLLLFDGLSHTYEYKYGFIHFVILVVVVQIFYKKSVRISVLGDCFYLSKQCRPW